MHPRRALRLLAAGALALTAWLHARGFSALLSAGLAPRSAHAATAPPASAAPPPERSADAILARNPFDSEWGRASRDPRDDGAARPDACGGVTVLAIAQAEGDSPSLVLLRRPGEKEPRMLSVGAEVLAIGREGVLLANDGQPCVARMFHGGAAGKGPAPDAGAPSKRVTGIEATGPNAYAVDRSVRDALIDGAADWGRTVALRPEKVGDDVVGLRIASMGPGTPLGALGLQAGDLLESVQGIPLTTPERVLGAFPTLRTAERLTLVLRRSGRDLQLDYVFR